jgi:hypothetical protein
MRRGDFVLITYCGQVKRALVMLASENQRSLMLGFDGVLRDDKGGMFVGALAALQEDDGTYVDLIGGQQVAIEPARSEP